MPFVTVRVSAPANRIIYINGNYQQPAGNTSTDSFVVPPGRTLFETLNGDRSVDFRKKFRVGRDDDEVTVALDPVDPPEPTAPAGEAPE